MNPLFALTAADFSFGSLVVVLFWTAASVLLLVGALKAFDYLTPGDLRGKAFGSADKPGEPAAAILYGAALIGIATVVASAIH